MANLEALAKLAYGSFAHRAGGTTPWEHLTNHVRQGWLEAIQAVLGDEDEVNYEGARCECCLSKLRCPVCQPVVAKPAPVLVKKKRTAPRVMTAGGVQ